MPERQVVAPERLEQGVPDGPQGASAGSMISSPRPPRTTRRAGFTMIEMLIVFIVFGISAKIALRSVGDTLRRNRVTKTAAVLSTDLEQGFSIAARLRVPVRVRIYHSATRRQFIVRQRDDT